MSLTSFGLTMDGYLVLLEWTISVEREYAVELTGMATEVLRKIGHPPMEWLTRVKSHRMKYRAYGGPRLLRQYADKLGQRWIKGSTVVSFDG